MVYGRRIELGLIRASARARGSPFRSPHISHTRQHSTVYYARLEVAHVWWPAALARCRRATAPVPRRSRGHFQAARNGAKAAEVFLQAARYALDVFANDEARETASAGLSLIDSSDNFADTFCVRLLAVRERALARVGAPAERAPDAFALYGTVP